jgi:hypothetical protein
MVPVLLMIAAGVAIAFGFLASVGIAEQAKQRQPPAPTRESIAASLLFNVLVAGGDRPDEALRDIRRVAGLGAAAAASVDIVNWGERFAQGSSQQQREWLLETAVRLASERRKTLPLPQYSALLDLAFGLGFHIDALAKLRERYPFDYVDHAKYGRPREADRGGGSLPLFVRSAKPEVELLGVLGIEGTATRQLIISRYRRLAAQYHPDRVFGQTAEIQAASAERFREITRAYEALLAIYRD